MADLQYRLTILLAANYKHYFLYLSSRTANTFPALTDVEFIIKRPESIPLPVGEEWNHYFIRPRGVYFDDKHGQFTVFADYLFPSGRVEAVANPEEIDKVLRDGMGLYEDDQGMMRYLTHWDLRFDPTNEISDHFHLDHKIIMSHL